MKILILIALCFVAATQAQDESPWPEFEGTCEARHNYMRGYAKTPFNNAAYVGTWYEKARYPVSYLEETDCDETFYLWSFTSPSYTIVRSGRASNGTEGGDFIVQRDATALLSYPDGHPETGATVGILNVTNFGDEEVASRENYVIIGTDYFQYAVTWGCNDIVDEAGVSTGWFREYAYLMSRTPTMPDNYRERLNEYADLHFDWAYIRETNQDTAFCLAPLSQNSAPMSESRLKFLSPAERQKYAH